MTDVVYAALAGYAAGCVCTGYYLVRLIAAEDIRRSGSGAAGATNVGRRLGPGGFAVTFVLDCGKGAAVAWAAGHFGLSAAETAAAIIAAVCGHIWPVQLGFRGGKGIATSLGALAVYDPRIVLVMASVFLVCFVVLRVFVVSGLLAFVLAPLLLIRSGLPGDHLLTAAAVAGIVLIPHRDVVRDALAVRRVAPTHRR